MKLNLNDIVKVKIRPLGHEILESNYRYFIGCLIDKYPYTQPRVDENGYSEMQLWEVARQFGTYMLNGAELPIETEIIIPDALSALGDDK